MTENEFKIGEIVKYSETCENQMWWGLNAEITDIKNNKYFLKPLEYPTNIGENAYVGSWFTSDLFEKTMNRNGANEC